MGFDTGLVGACWAKWSAARKIEKVQRGLHSANRQRRRAAVSPVRLVKRTSQLGIRTVTDADNVR